MCFLRGKGGAAGFRCEGSPGSRMLKDARGPEKQWPEGRPGRGGAVHVQRGCRSRERIFLVTREKDVCKRNVGHLPLQTRRNRTDPWPLKFHTQVHQTETTSSLRIKWAERKRSPQYRRRILHPRRHQECLAGHLSGGTGRRCPQSDSACTLVARTGEGPKVDQPGAGPQASSGSGQTCRQ